MSVLGFIRKPLSKAAVKSIMNKDDRIAVNIPVSLEDLIDCGGIESLNDIADNLILDGVGILSDISYNVAGALIDSNDVIIHVDAQVELL